jgi:hypothetical protein
MSLEFDCYGSGMLLSSSIGSEAGSGLCAFCVNLEDATVEHTNDSFRDGIPDHRSSAIIAGQVPASRPSARSPRASRKATHPFRALQNAALPQHPDPGHAETTFSNAVMVSRHSLFSLGGSNCFSMFAAWSALPG